MATQTNLLDLLSDVNTEEVIGNEDLVTSTGINFISQGGVYSTTIERAFLKETLKGGASLHVHTKGDNVIQLMAFPINVDKKGKKTTTSEYKGKTTTNQDYKIFKQLFYVTGNAVVELNDVKKEVQTITYKSYGVDVTEEVLMLTDLTDKELHIGLKAKYEYNYEDGETDKTCYKTDRDGNPRLSLSISKVYDNEGRTPMEMIKDVEAKDIEGDREYLASEKAIYKPKLEEAEEEIEVEAQPEELKF